MITTLMLKKQIIVLFDRISRKPLTTRDDYENYYDDHFYTYTTWEQLVESEKYQIEGLTEEELKHELEEERGSVWKLPCGWYIQYV